MKFPDKVKISVTAKDIREGCRAKMTNCPIAKAFMRAFESKRVSVIIHALVVYNKRGSDYENYALPDKAQDFIYKFDTGRAVKPFRFTATKVRAFRFTATKVL